MANLLGKVQNALVNLRDFSVVDGGESGKAWFAYDESGTRLVVKLTDGSIQWARAQHALVASLRSRNYPAPVFRNPIDTAFGAITIQEAVDGHATILLDSEFAQQMLALNALHEDINPIGFTPFKDTLLESLETGFEDYCVHDVLRNHSTEATHHLDWMQAVGRESSDLTVSDADAVHYDFHQLNVLRTPNNEPACVIDWEGCRSGDRAFDVVTLGIDATPYAEPKVIDSLRSHLIAHTTPDALRLFGAHMLLRLLDWNIRSHDAERVESRLQTTRLWRDWLDNL